MKMTTAVATLAEAEDELDEESVDDDDEDSSGAEICTFDVPYFRYIDDDDDVEEDEGGSAGGWSDGGASAWGSYSSEEDSCDSYRYVVVSGTPLKILEHLLSDLRLDDQRGAPESRESGKSLPLFPV